MKAVRALAALQSLCGLGLHAEALVPAVLEALHGVVPSYRNLFDWTDSQGRLLRYFIEGPIDTAVAQLYFDEFHNRREAEAMPAFDSLRGHAGGVRSAAELDHPAFFKSALYQHVWRPQGFHTRLEAVLRGKQGQLLGSLVLYRSPHEPKFSSADEKRLAEAIPIFAAALEGCNPAPDERHVHSPDPAQTLVFSLQGQLHHASAGAHALLLVADGGASREALSRPMDALAQALVPRLLTKLRERANLPVALRGLQPTVSHESRTGQFVASGDLLVASQLSSAHQAAEPLAQITLRRLEPHRVALERALRHLPIAPGQAMVCRALYHGHSHAQIGQHLGVAPATVVDHVRKAYRTLDVRSALELRAHLDRKIAEGGSVSMN
jgi:DNA-binding CsgD family transcriptional regulator